MKKSFPILLILLAFSAATATAQNPIPPELQAKIDALPQDDWGESVRYGLKLMTETQAVIGPEVDDPEMRYAGNNLRCHTCHLQAGTKKFAAPFTGIYGLFPQYRPREDQIGTLTERINGCLERSMNGKPLPVHSREMKAMLSYIRFLSDGVPTGEAVEGRGLMPFDPPSRKVDLANGEAVYNNQCASCHGADGQGMRMGQEGDAQGYLFSPLWGDDSYNTGAGMYRVLKASRFIRYNMPPSANHEAPLLSVDDTYDVAGYINSKERPMKDHLEKDFPDRLKKPVDFPFGPYADSFSEEQHKFGPFQPIMKELQTLREQQQ